MQLNSCFFFFFFFCCCLHQKASPSNYHIGFNTLNVDCVHQVDLQFPKLVSEGARDLISKLLRHSPSMRLPLKSVMEHPWVKANSRRVLPPVCQPKPAPTH